jgi:hypothetical protein
MAIRLYKPTSPGRRNGSVIDYRVELTTDKREKSLCKRIKKHGGRNHHGKTTVRFRGGGARRIYRLVDFKRNKDGVVGTVATIEYDPNRTCFISLIKYADGEKRYILAPVGLKVDDTVESGEVVEPKVGNAMPLSGIPVVLETTQGSRVEAVSDDSGLVQFTIPDDFSEVKPGRRKNPPAELSLFAEYKTEAARYETTLSAAYYVDPGHWRSKGLGAAVAGLGLLAGGFIGGIGRGNNRGRK